MKNRLLKGAHLSERKCREIIQLFCEDLTATQIANITSVSRVTINAYLKMLRTSLASACESDSPLKAGASLDLHDPDQELLQTSYYGFTRSNGFIYTTNITPLDKNTLVEFQKTKSAESPLASFQAIADFSNWRLYRLDSSLNGMPRNTMDEISGFWGLTKNRLLKFRGLNRNTLHLHIKECEFRYNHRNENINHILLQLINKRPLHQARMDGE
jgi:transposase